MRKRRLFALGLLGFSVLLATIVTCLVISERPEVPVVTTATAGRITGRTLDGVREFLNIKYARDPIGELRFQPPVPLNRSADEDVDATNDETVMCVKGIRSSSNEPVGVEECLVLSVRVPVEKSKESKLPIVVWIHGGGLMWGWGEMPGYSFDRATTEKMGVMTVNINYRVGFLGWAALAGISPNNGLQDMIIALNWVKDNGAAFGGDPDDVTVVGESAGATSILALLRSPLADGLFNRAVSLSPAPEMETKENVMEIQKTVWLPVLGCDQIDADDAELLKCLVEADIAKFAPVVTKDFLGYGYSDFPLRNGVDNKVAEAVGLIFQDGKVISRDTLESSATVHVILSNLVDEVAFMQPANAEIESSWDKASPIITSLLPRVANKDNITADDLITGPYLDLEPSGIWNRLVTDMRSTCPTNTLAAENSETNITRVLITHHLVIGGFAGRILPANHGYDSHALFGFNPSSWVAAIDEHFGKPTDAERGFQDVMIDLVMRETGGSGGHVVLGRTEDGGAERREEKGMPREETCQWLAENGISGYGCKN